MIEPPPLYSDKRHVHDILEIESLARLVTELNIPLNSTICETFERLVELAGTRDFMPAFSQLQHGLMNVKWVREGHLASLAVSKDGITHELLQWSRSSYDEEPPVAPAAEHTIEWQGEV